MSDPDLRALALEPPLATASIPGIGGRLRSRPEDFRVEEIPAYPPDGRLERHLLVQIEKRAIDTQEAVRRLVRACDIPRSEVGVAGRKDKDAVTRQWLSLPWVARPGLDAFDDPDLRVLEIHPHGQKLRTGHLRGNRFTLIVREVEGPVTQALARAEAKLALLCEQGGLENLYGAQRFGWEGRNLERGMALLRGGRMRRSDNFVVSAAQSALFNLYVVERRRGDSLRKVLEGDVLQLTDRGGMFTVEDLVAEQARLDRGELVLTGPMPGAKMRAPTPGSASEAFEHEVLERAGLDLGALKGFGKRLPGTRRAAQIDVSAARVRRSEEDDALQFDFTLPAGSFATQLMREVQGTAEPHFQESR